MRAFLVFCLLVLVAACASPSEVPAPTAEKLRAHRVFVFVPGYEGSRLVRADDGSPVWVSVGETLFRSRSLRLPLPSLALGPALELKAEGVLERVSVIPGIYGVDIYGTFLAGLRTLAKPGDEVLALAYDWRQDPMLTVARLAAIVASARHDGASEIVLLGHSLGGYIVSYYLRYGAQDPASAKETWEGAHHVDRVVLAGVPFLGAMKTLRNMQFGDATGWNHTLLEPLAVASFPSCFHLLPAGPTDLLLTARRERVLGAIQQPALWRQQGWGLLQPSQDAQKNVDAGIFERRYDYVAQWLGRAAQFSQKLLASASAAPKARKPLLYLYGKGHPTLARGLWLRTTQPRVESLVFDAEEGHRRFPEIAVSQFYEDGDGVVTTTSAALPRAFVRAWQVQEKCSEAEHLALVSEREGQEAVSAFLNGAGAEAR